MTLEEAIKAIRYINLSKVHPFLSREEMLEVRDSAITALEKQIPKKPIMRKDVAETYYICPECEWEVDKFDDNYCSDCGQKLDWSSEK